MSTKRMIDETKEDGTLEWFKYRGGVIKPGRGDRYTHIRVDDGTTRIDNRAFVHCSKLLRVEICEGVREIGWKSFYECDQLESVMFPSTLTSIGEYAFYGCKKLKRVDLKLAGGLESIDSGALCGCESLEGIIFPLASATSIRDRAFMDCKALKIIDIPSSVTRIPYRAFFNCDSLKHVALYEGLVSIEEDAFRGCKSLESISIPSGVTCIEKRAFENCLALEEITIPPTVQHVSPQAFKSCQNLKDVDLCGGSPKIWVTRAYPNISVVLCQDAFSDCPNLDHGNIIATGKMDIDIFRRYAMADLSRRIGSMADECKTIIETKLFAIPNHIIADLNDFTHAGRIPQSMQDGLAKIHGLITYWELKDPTTILELAIWKVNLHDETTDVKSREQIRQQCGRDMQVILSGVLRFFDYNANE